MAIKLVATHISSSLPGDILGMFEVESRALRWWRILLVLADLRSRASDKSLADQPGLFCPIGHGGRQSQAAFPLRSPIMRLIEQLLTRLSRTKPLTDLMTGLRQG